MLQRNFTPELIDLVNEMCIGQALTRPTLEAIRVGVEREMWQLWITHYNIKQIVRMNESDWSNHSVEEAAESIIKKSYDTSFIKTFETVKEKDYVKKSRLLWSANVFLEHVQTFIEWYKPHPIVVSNVTRIYNRPSSLVIALTDLHIGKQGTDLVINRLDKIASDIISQSIETVEIFCLGDLVETLTQWGMHDWQIEEMDNVYGFNLLLKTVSIFENFLMRLSAQGIVVKFHGLSWNHDRMTKDRDWDKARMWGLVIYELIKRGLSNQPNIHINIVQDYITTVDIDHVRYILAHGDMARVPSRKGSDLAWNHGSTAADHNVIMHGHLHNVAISEEKGITKIGLPGLAGTDTYATKELDLHSEPGYVQIVKNEFGSVDVSIKRLMKW